MLTRAGCEARQRRFRAVLAERGLDAAVITDFHEVSYLTGLPYPSLPMALYLPVVLYLEVEGRTFLTAHTDEGEALADERATYPWHTYATTNPDLLGQLVPVTMQQLSAAAQPRRLGFQAEFLPRIVGETLAERLAPDEWIAIDEEIARLEKRKEPDEVALLRQVIACNLAAYDAVAGAIAPGVNELAVLGVGQSAAQLRAGEVVFHGGDYASAQLGGSARNRLVASGEMYIVDAQTRYRGYWSDLSRTYPVGDPSPLQREAYNHIAQILAEVPEMVQPGTRGTDLWQRIERRICAHPRLRDIGLLHHGGHGIGLRPHEAPDINRDRDSLFEVGDVFCCEPGVYSPELNFGVRLENTFLLTESGPELLSDYPVFQL